MTRSEVEDVLGRAAVTSDYYGETKHLYGASFIPLLWRAAAQNWRRSRSTMTVAA
jgi:hypothetical protein